MTKEFFIPTSTNRIGNDIKDGVIAREEAEQYAIDLLSEMHNYANPEVVENFATVIFDLASIIYVN